MNPPGLGPDGRSHGPWGVARWVPAPVVMAHHAAWDDTAFVIVPIGIFAGLLYLANRRALAQQARSRPDAHARSTPPGEERTGAGCADEEPPSAAGPGTGEPGVSELGTSDGGADPSRRAGPDEAAGPPHPPLP